MDSSLQSHRNRPLFDMRQRLEQAADEVGRDIDHKSFPITTLTTALILEEGESPDMSVSAARPGRSNCEPSLLVRAGTTIWSTTAGILVRHLGRLRR